MIWEYNRPKREYIYFKENTLASYGPGEPGGCGFIFLIYLANPGSNPEYGPGVTQEYYSKVFKPQLEPLCTEKTNIYSSD